MRRSRLKKIALAAALAATMAASAPTFALAQSDLMATLSSQVLTGDYAASRATVAELEERGVGAISIGSDMVTLVDLLVMIDATEQGQLDRVQFASYLDAIAKNTAEAIYLPAEAASPASKQ